MAKTLTNKVNAALMKVDEGDYEGAYDQLINDVLKKTDGCETQGSPDKNDWIIYCEEQGQIYPIIIDTINLLENLL